MAHSHQGTLRQSLVPFAGLLLGLLGWFPGFAIFAASSHAADQRPHIVLINLDDADTELLSDGMLNSYYPSILDLADNGIRFTNVHATTPLCAASRAAPFRGQYAFRTGIKVNDATNVLSNGFTGGYPEFIARQHDQSELGVWLRSAGYRTMHVGKYHHHDFDERVPPGWEEFRISASVKYWGAKRFTNQFSAEGEWIQLGPDQYMTNVDADDSVELINRHASDRDARPMFLSIAPIAPHLAQSGNPYDMVDHERYGDFATGLTIPVAPDLQETDLGDKPTHMQFEPVPTDWQQFLAAEYTARVRAMKSVDDLVQRVVAALDEHGYLDQTVILLTSDNGYQLGHHRCHNKQDPYHRTTNVPLIVRGPGIGANQTADHLLAQLDICPTILDLAGVAVPGLDGRSFVSLLDRAPTIPSESWQTEIMIENWQEKVNFGLPVEGAYVALRMHHEIVVSWANGQFEYYDLNLDPYQLQNGWNQLTIPQRQDFKRRLRRFRVPLEAPNTVASPVYRSLLQSRRFRVEGYAEHAVGVWGTLVTIRSFETQRFWNGTNWQDAWYGKFVPVANPNQPITTWSIAESIRTETETGFDRLLVTFRSLDAAGQLPDFVNWTVVPIDGKYPAAWFAEGLHGSTFDTASVQLAGRGYDGVMFAGANLVIRRIDDNLYWNGDQLQTDWTPIPVIADPDRNWQYHSSLPPGRYVASIRGVDSAGNRQPTVKVISFNVR